MKIVTVNCARIIHGNQVATNGVVHVIDRVISGVGNTIKDVLDVNDELSSFSVRRQTGLLKDIRAFDELTLKKRKQPKNALITLVLLQAAALASGMMDKLGRPGHYTLFAPTNDAFNKLSPGHWKRMMGDKDVIAGMFDAFVPH